MSATCSVLCMCNFQPRWEKRRDASSEKKNDVYNLEYYWLRLETRVTSSGCSLMRNMICCHQELNLGFYSAGSQGSLFLLPSPHLCWFVKLNCHSEGFLLMTSHHQFYLLNQKANKGSPVPTCWCVMTLSLKSTLKCTFCSTVLCITILDIGFILDCMQNVFCIWWMST